MSNRKEMCVYLHLDKEGVIRYVGSGTLERPYVMRNRSKQWHILFKDIKPNVVIVQSGLVYEDAIALEYYMYYSCIDTIINIHPPFMTLNMDFKSFDDQFYVDNNSPSGLSYKDHIKSKEYLGRTVGSKTHSGVKSYWKVSVNGSRYLAHRIVYLLTYGAIDSHRVINHIDGNGLNNTISNLEQVTQKVNTFKKLKKLSNGLPSGISLTKQKGTIVGYHASYVKAKSNERVMQRFSVVALGSMELALKAAKLWREYYTHIEGVEISTRNIEDMAVELKEYLRTMELKRSDPSSAHRTHNKWKCSITIKSKPVYCGSFDTPEEAVNARDKIIKDYNDSIVIEL